MDSAKNGGDNTDKSEKGFNTFCFEVASFFTLVLVKKLASVFEYSTDEIKGYDNVSDPGLAFIKSLVEKSIISANNISQLLEALKAIDRRGVADDVKILFEQSSKKEQRKGFSQFLDDVASLLTLALVKRLANVFDYSTEEIEDFENVKDPGFEFTKSLNKKQVITPSDISRLSDALKVINRSGAADDVKRLFEQSCQQTQIEARKEIFIDELKKAYRELYDRIRPVPLSTDDVFQVNDVFVDSGVEYLEKKGLKKSWKRLESYHHIFREEVFSSKRLILYGEAGFGKSTLVLQFAYDWSTGCKESLLREVDILICLRLNKLNHNVSIFKGIEQRLLSKESNLIASDVEEILKDCRSGVMVLEGYDKYISKDSVVGSEVRKIMKCDMFANFRVIITTTPSCKAENMPSTIAEVRLSGFDSKAQDKYLKKAFETKQYREHIKSLIESNPVIHELCTIPFIFCMVLNLILQEREPFNFNTVTGFFRYVFASFYEQMKRKLKDEDQKRLNNLATEHRELDKLSYEALTKDDQNKKWVKDKLRESIGRDLYDQYVAVGILVEDDEVFVDDTPGVPDKDLVRRETHTRFYHNLFREWFAAHYISEYVGKIFTVNFNKTMRKLLDKSLYVFQFACGLKPHSASKIIKFLQKTDGCTILARKCISEKNEQRLTKGKSTNNLSSNQSLK